MTKRRFDGRKRDSHSSTRFDGLSLSAHESCKVFQHLSSQPSRFRGPTLAGMPSASIYDQILETSEEEYARIQSRETESLSRLKPQGTLSQELEQLSPGGVSREAIIWRSNLSMERFLGSTERHERYWQPYTSKSHTPRQSQSPMRRNLSPAEDEESIVLDTGTIKEVSDASYFDPPLPVVRTSEVLGRKV